jgi:16S rRNA (cytidine1402-2'-O)-methyltransferase
MARGRLVIVPTPIGNLEDMSARARRELDEADVVLAEDTRRTRALLSHLGIHKPLERLDAQVERRDVDELIARLASGTRMALVSDAGTPVVSDPGAALVRAAAQAEIEICALPGASAVTTALAGSGFAADRFRFVGYLPRSGGDRRVALALIAGTEETVVFFEAPQRMARTLLECAELMPSRDIAIARELSKLHEEWIRGPLEGVAKEQSAREWQGELTVVLAPHRHERARISEEELDTRIDELAARGMRPRDIAKALALESDWPSRTIYARITARRK